MRLSGAPLAISFLIKTLRDETVDTRLRIDVAKTLLDRVGLGAVKMAEPGDPVDPHDMGTQELRTMLRDMERELGDRASLIEGDASAAPSQVTDLM